MAEHEARAVTIKVCLQYVGLGRSLEKRWQAPGQGLSCSLVLHMSPVSTVR